MSDNYKVARSDDGLGGVCQPYQDWLTVSGQFLLARPPVYKTYRADVSIRFNSANLTDGQRERERFSGPSYLQSSNKVFPVDSLGTADWQGVLDLFPDLQYKLY